MLSREFLGWEQPALPAAARKLVARYRQGRHLDLSRVLVVVPGQRAGRRLGEWLAFLAQDEHLRLTPPDVVTQSVLPERLYQPKRPFGNDVVQEVAWSQALLQVPAEELRHVVPQLPQPTEALRWLQLAKILRHLHVELAGDGLDFAAVLHAGRKLGEFPQAARWQALAMLQRRYLDLMDQQELWDLQTARLKAVEFREIHTASDIILLGTVDLNVTLRHMLDQVAARVTAYVIAPLELADRFDGLGTLIPSQWSIAAMPLRDEQLRQVEGPVEQADAVTAWLANLGGRFRRDEVVIGAADASLVPQVQRQLEQCGVRARWVEGLLLRETAPYLLLAAAAKFASHRRFEDLAALVRHPDLEDWLLKALPTTSLLSTQLDRFYNEHLPGRIRSTRGLPPSPHWPELAPALQRIDAWLEPASTSHPLRKWGEIFREMLGAIYGGRILSLDEAADETLHRTFLRLLQECDRLASLPEALDTAAFSAADAFEVVAVHLGQEALPPPADPDAVEVLGWLELPLDDAPALLVTTFNEGYVPQSAAADAFLPDRLRRDLGLLHNERRYARDAYALSVLCHSREELQIVFARRDAQNNPLQPSRLVFACEDEALVRRARRFFDAPKATGAPRRLLLAPNGPIPDKSTFVVPPPLPPRDKPQRIPVTRFKTYLACPYRYYLRHVRKLQAVDDAAREMDGSAFGILLHGALSALGRDPGAPRHSPRDKEVLQFLDERLQVLAHQRYGARERRGAVRLQIEQARQRLHSFAAQQAALVREGWSIVHAEAADSNRSEWGVPFRVNGDAIQLVGRIDRIDFNVALRTVRILDYKTADRGQTPQQTHRNGDRWVDLQLPLYRHLWKAARLEVPEACAVQLGYFNLPRQLEGTKVALAEWDDTALDDADATARQVAQQLLASVYWPPKYPAPEFNEDLAAICQDHALSRPLLSDEP
jgi:ATP-dependent helicase/nuclease subunit B